MLLFPGKKTALYGRIVFGASAVLFGVIALMWYDSDTWQTLRQIWSLPFGAIIGGCLMVGQIAGGIGMQYPRTVRLASIVLGIVYLLFSLACIPGIIAAPAAYPSFLEQFSALCGAISFTLSQIVYFSATAALVPKWIPPNQAFWGLLTTTAFGLAATSILINRQARLAIRLMTLMLALFGVLVWIPRLIAHPEAHLNWSEFGLTLLITGAAGMVADLKS